MVIRIMIMILIMIFRGRMVRLVILVVLCVETPDGLTADF